jgi:chemotaxis family two-component system sensor kinase Cph1
LPGEIETTLYRVVQEALTNVVKHAGAEHVSVVLGRRDGGVSVVVEDDGRGFIPDEVRENALGLLGMRERLALVNGTLTVEATPDAGTSVVAYVPLPGQAVPELDGDG